MTRLSAKQRDFLKFVEEYNRPTRLFASDEEMSMAYYAKDFAWNWGFLTDGAGERWLKNLQDRGLITIKNVAFIRITEAGKAAIGNSQQ